MVASFAVVQPENYTASIQQFFRFHDLVLRSNFYNNCIFLDGHSLQNAKTQEGVWAEMNALLGGPLLISCLGLFLIDYENKVIDFAKSHLKELEDRTSVKKKLAQLGMSNIGDYEEFRTTQACLIIPPILLIGVLTILDLIAFEKWVLLSLLLAFGIVFVTETNLTFRVRKRVEDIENEFSVVVELMTLAIGSGMSPINSLQLIASRGKGFLPDEFKNVIQDVKAGSSLSDSLDQMSKRINLPLIRRLVDSMIISASRGTPLVEAMRHNVQTSRAIEKTKLIAASGKSEIAMMIPVIFLILPISILFALYPTFTTLSLFS